MTQNPVESKSSDTSSSSSSAVDAVANWDRIIHKNVRTLDNQGMGKVIAVPNEEDTIIISSQSGGEQYKIPKSFVSGFNGAEVLLNQTAYKSILLPIRLIVHSHMKQNPAILSHKSALRKKDKKRPLSHS